VAGGDRADVGVGDQVGAATPRVVEAGGGDEELAHGVLSGPLGGGEQGHGDGAAAPGDRVGVVGGVGCLVGEFGVLVDDYDEGGGFGGRLPHACAFAGEGVGAGIKDAFGVPEQRGGLAGIGGEAVEAAHPGA
jgi:hypothetical protein